MSGVIAGEPPLVETVHRDEVGFHRAFDAHYRDVLAYAHRRAGDADAEDVAAETFAIAWRRWATAPPDAVRPWLFGIARRVLANTNRGLRRRDRLVAKIGSLSGEPPGYGDEHVEVARALDRLRAADREIIRLHCWEGLAASEIAVALRCSPNAAGIRLHRAKQRFARALTDVAGEMR